jgi:hypothetical protein
MAVTPTQSNVRALFCHLKVLVQVAQGALASYFIITNSAATNLLAANLESQNEVEPLKTAGHFARICLRCATKM